MARLTNRVQKLEQSKGAGEKRLVIPHCCFYNDSSKECDCMPYYTLEPMDRSKGMADFYSEVNEPCKPIPKGVEIADWNGLTARETFTTD